MRLRLRCLVGGIVLAIVTATLIPPLAWADQPRPSDPVLTLETPAPVMAGLTTSVTVIAHFVTVEGKPIVGADLLLSVDGSVGRKEKTDETGTAYLRVRQDLTEGTHQIEVRFDATNGVLSWVKPSRAVQSLVVLPASTTLLTLDPLEPITVGDRTAVSVVAHLTKADGTAISGEDVKLVVDDTPERLKLTDATGTASLLFRRDLAIGEHRIVVTYAGAPGLRPAEADRHLIVLPPQPAVLTVDPLPSFVIARPGGVNLVVHLATGAGAPVVDQQLELRLDGAPEQSATTDSSGRAQLRISSNLPLGQHQLTVSFGGGRGVQASSVSRTISIVSADQPVLTVDPIGPIRAGQAEPLTVVAHLVAQSGEPIGLARLGLNVDGTVERRAPTDASGTALLQLSRDLTPGTHLVEVTFDGKGNIAPVTASARLQVIAPVPSALILDPLPSVAVGQSQPVTVTVHLLTPDGKPVVRLPVTFVVDTTPIRTEMTDATGTAYLRLHQDFDARQHQLEARFAGTGDILPSHVIQDFSVKPAELTVQMAPPLPGIRVSFDGHTFTSGDDGVVQIQANRSGVFRLEILRWDSTVPGMRAKFARWMDDVFVPYRDVKVPSTTRLQAGFATEDQVRLQFLDPANQPVPPVRISSATLLNSTGDRFVFDVGETKWLPGGRVVKASDGLEESKFFYSVESVFVETSDVVYAKQQKFFPSPNLTFPIHLLLYSAVISANDAFFGMPIGTSIRLDYPDGHSERHSFGPGARLSLGDLVRGEYGVTVEGAGPPVTRPLAVTRDVQESVQVLTYDDLILALFVALLFALGLPLLGHPHLFFLVVHPREWFRRPNKVLVTSAAGRDGHS